MADTLFSVGDVVILKSGGCPLTVKRMNPVKECTWDVIYMADGRFLTVEQVPGPCLQKYVPPKEKPK